ASGESAGAENGSGATGEAPGGNGSTASETPADGSADAGPGARTGPGGDSRVQAAADPSTTAAADAASADRSEIRRSPTSPPPAEPPSDEPEHVRAQAGDPVFDGLDAPSAAGTGGLDEPDDRRRDAGPGPARSTKEGPAANGSRGEATDAAGALAAFVDEVRRAKQPLAAYLDHAELAFEDGGLVVLHDAGDQVLRSRLENPANREILDQAVRRTWGPAARWVARAGRLAPDGDGASPEEDELAAGGDEAQPGPEVLEHPTVQTVLELFGGTIATVEERDD
ncbi:MAG TPA: hypothetical protein VHQ65_00150, partial [Thermoanaerobaculia bacterium]|nr:hypothetical protein [Thermoanaerobaculia bacterium]